MVDSNRNKSQKKYPVHLSDDRVIDSLNAMGFYDSWITAELIKSHRNVLEAEIKKATKAHKAR